MACKFGVVLTILAGLCVTLPAMAQGGSGVDGVWLTQAGDAKVRVSRCGGGICGVVAWLKDPIDPVSGKRQIDDKNPNPALAKASHHRVTAFHPHALCRLRQMVRHDL
jgi:uncharacterized protein (DUF2147 family)